MALLPSALCWQVQIRQLNLTGPPWLSGGSSSKVGWSHDDQIDEQI
jgi:hypothetical protein